VPEGFVLRDDAATRTRTTETVKEIGAGVFAIQNIGGTDSSVLVVLFPDFALVAGTPDAATERVLSIAGERWPRQPIRYAIPTHHHWEHAAGLRTYIANGTTIVTTPGNRELFATAANARFAIRPDALARSPRPADIEVIEGRTRAIASGGQRVVLHDLGPTSHAEEMMIVHVPGAGVVYQADLLEIDDDDPVDRFTANRVTVEFLRRLEQLELDVKMIVGAEGKIGTMEDLRQAVRLFDATMQ
jgi:glyoxylase-like metal-dependent hydrolase (beta-lactamase superfamily II)